MIVAAILPAVTYVGNKLVEKGVEKAASEFIDWLFDRFRGKEPEKKIGDIVITLPDGTSVQFNDPSRPGISRGSRRAFRFVRSSDSSMRTSFAWDSWTAGPG